MSMTFFYQFVTEYGTTLITILPVLFLYLNTVIVTAGTFEPTISLEMPVPSQGHYGFHSFPVVD